MLPPFIDTLWNASAFPLLSIINWTKYKYLLPLQHVIMKKVKNSEEKGPYWNSIWRITFDINYNIPCIDGERYKRV